MRSNIKQIYTYVAALCLCRSRANARTKKWNKNHNDTWNEENQRRNPLSFSLSSTHSSNSTFEALLFFGFVWFGLCASQRFWFNISLSLFCLRKQRNEAENIYIAICDFLPWLAVCRCLLGQDDRLVCKQNEFRMEIMCRQQKRRPVFVYDDDTVRSRAVWINIALHQILTCLFHMGCSNSFAIRLHFVDAVISFRDMWTSELNGLSSTGT